jgi:hypothetical protein
VKKIRLSLKKSATYWSFNVFDSVEAAYYLREDPVDSVAWKERATVMSLEQKEFVEIEWLGCEYYYVDTNHGPNPKISLNHERYDNIRAVKMLPSDVTSAKTSFVELYTGWVVGGAVPWTKQAAQKDIRIIPINEKVHSKFDFSKLFSATQAAHAVEASNVVAGKIN